MTFKRNPAADINLDSSGGNADAYGLSFNEQGFAYVTDVIDDFVYVYSSSTSNRFFGREWSTSSQSQQENRHLRDIAIDGTTAYCLDWADDKIYAYQSNGGSRQSGNDIDLHSSNSDPRGIDIYQGHLYVTDDTKVFVYSTSTKARVTSREWDLASDNNDPSGIAIIQNEAIALVTADVSGTHHITAYDLNSSFAVLGHRGGSLGQSQVGGIALWNNLLYAIIRTISTDLCHAYFPSLTPLALPEVEFTAGAPSFTANTALVTDTDTRMPPSEFTAGSPTFTATLNLLTPTPLTLPAVEFMAGEPSFAAGQLEQETPTPLALPAVEFTAGAPEFTAIIQKVGPQDLFLPHTGFLAGCPEFKATPDPMGLWTNIGIFRGDTATIHDLLPDRRYQVRVRAITLNNPNRDISAWVMADEIKTHAPLGLDTAQVTHVEPRDPKTFIAEFIRVNTESLKPGEFYELRHFFRDEGLIATEWFSPLYTQTSFDPQEDVGRELTMAYSGRDITILTERDLPLTSIDAPGERTEAYKRNHLGGISSDPQVI